MKNTNNALPLDVSKYKTVAIIGPNANNSVVIQGNYHGTPCFTYTILDGVKEYYTKYIMDFKEKEKYHKIMLCFDLDGNGYLDFDEFIKGL